MVSEFSTNHAINYVPNSVFSVNENTIMVYFANNTSKWSLENEVHSTYFGMHLISKAPFRYVLIRTDITFTEIHLDEL